MRIGAFAALSVASVFGLACSDSPSSATDPGVNVRFAQTEGPCSSASSKLAKAQLMDLLAGATLKQAQANWAAVESACTVGNPDAANGALMVYVNYLRGLYPDGFITSRAGTKSALFVAHIDTVFEYVGYTAPGLTTTILESGIVQVILPGALGTREYLKAHLGAFKLPAQNASDHATSPGDPRGHLFAMFALTTPNCLSVDNLRELSVPCVEVMSFPPVNPKFSPGIKVGICVPLTATAGAKALGHEVNSKTEVAGQLSYPADCHQLAAAGSWTGGPQELLKRLAWIGKSTFGIQPAYASDAGLGGIGGFLSPFNVLDALIFAASFNVPPNVVGSPPVLVNGNFTFVDTVAAPGSILVQNSLGQYTNGPLVVLSQGGGNCANCGGLLLRGFFHSESGAPADDGVYDINWISVQASPSVKGAPLVTRDGAGCEVARLTYVTTNSQNQLLYNGAVVSSWVRNVPQAFKIRVDLDNNTTRLFIGPDSIPLSQGPNPVYTTPFVNKTAAGAVCAANDIASLAAEFSGIDSGVMGWDEIGVQRISDQPTPNY